MGVPLDNPVSRDHLKTFVTHLAQHFHFFLVIPPMLRFLIVISPKSQHPINFLSGKDILFVIYLENFLFGTEIRTFQINPEGWMVGVWDGDSWDPSQQFWGPEWPSQQNPNK